MCHHNIIPSNYNNNPLNFSEPKFYQSINKFLKLHSDGNIIGIVGFKKQIHTIDSGNGFGQLSFTTTNIKFGHTLIIECRCKDNATFPTINVLGDMLYSTFKPVLTEFSEIRLEYHCSMYFSRD